MKKKCLTCFDEVPCPKTQFNEPGKTEKSHMKKCDINTIVNQFTKTGLVNHVRTTEPVYEISDPFDLREALDIVHSAEQMFRDLPAKLRKKYNNDPVELAAAVQTQEGIDELAEHGVHITNGEISPTPPAEPVVAPPVGSTENKDAPSVPETPADKK